MYMNEYSMVKLCPLLYLQDRLQDLEATVLSLKRQMTQRDTELDDMRAANRNLENELHQARTSPAPSGSQEVGRFKTRD